MVADVKGNITQNKGKRSPEELNVRVGSNSCKESGFPFKHQTVEQQWKSVRTRLDTTGPLDSAVAPKRPITPLPVSCHPSFVPCHRRFSWEEGASERENERVSTGEEKREQVPSIRPGQVNYWLRRRRTASCPTSCDVYSHLKGVPRPQRSKLQRKRCSSGFIST